MAAARTGGQLDQVQIINLLFFSSQRLSYLILKIGLLEELRETLDLNLRSCLVDNSIIIYWLFFDISLLSVLMWQAL